MRKADQKWETVNSEGVRALEDNRSEVTSRMPVNGGYLYRHTVRKDGEVVAMTMCFVPGE